MLGYGAVRNLRCKSGARFPPSTVSLPKKLREKINLKEHSRKLTPVHVCD